MGKLFKWAKPYKGLIILILALSIFFPITYSYVPQFYTYIIDIVLKRNPETVTTLPKFLTDFFGSFNKKIVAVIIIGLTLAIYQFIRGILMFENGILKGKFGENVAFDMRTNLYYHIQNLSYSYHNNVDTGDLIQRCTSDIDTIKSFLSSQLPQILNLLATIGAGIYQMSLISVKIMLVTLISTPITFLASVIYFKYVEKKFEFVEEIESQMTTALQENVNGVRVVKAFANEKYEIDKFNDKSKKYAKESVKLNNAMAIYWGCSDGLTTLQYGATVVVSIFLAKSGGITAGQIMACFLYISMLIYPIRGLGRILGNFGKSLIAAKRANEILEIKDEYMNDGKLEPEITGHIKFDDVSFKFDDTDQHLLNNVSFEIEPGETIAIIGKTGSGKSTIANLLVRMLEYDKGSIKLDGVELKDIKKHCVRNNVGIILQDPFLYAKTIFENIKIANSKLTTFDVKKAAEIASVAADIEKFDDGYDTLVGEKGVTLSGGQKQRISIARMLVLNKPIMIFDDSLSAVDTKTDLNIRNALKLRDSKLTTIIITHRITTAKEADKIIVLENGKVSDIGTHHELASREGLYKKLWSIQGALEDEFMSLVKDVTKNE